MRFETMNAWHEQLKAVMLAQTPLGYRKVSWQQLRAADQALFQRVALDCEAGTKAADGKTQTRFEESWLKHVFGHDVRAFLTPLPAQQASSSSTSNPNSKEIEKLKNRLASAEQALKRRRTDGGDAPKGNGKGKKKDGKGGRDRRGKTTDNATVPPEWGDLPTKIEGQRICFAFNKQGCALAKPGESCWKGLHLCPKCHGKHPFGECPRK